MMPWHPLMLELLGQSRRDDLRREAEEEARLAMVEQASGEAPGFLRLLLAWMRSPADVRRAMLALAEQER